MNLRFYWVSLTIFYTLASCQNNVSHNTKNSPDTDSLQYYPLQTYFKMQVNQAASTNNPKILKTTTAGVALTDTLDNEAFYTLTSAFTEIDVLEGNLKTAYRESAFADLSTNSYTFNYESTDSTLPIKDITILIDTSSSLVKRVFITRQWYNSDSSVIEKLGWQHDKSCYINRFVKYSNKTISETRLTLTF